MYHGKETTEKLMLGVVLALLPALFASVFYFGMGAIIVTAASVISCVAFEYLIQRFLLRKPVSITDGSAVVTGLLLAFNLPSNLPSLHCGYWQPGCYRNSKNDFWWSG